MGQRASPGPTGHIGPFRQGSLASWGSLRDDSGVGDVGGGQEQEQEGYISNLPETLVRKIRNNRVRGERNQWT